MLKRNKKTLLESFLEDPTRSLRDIAKELESYRQKMWREKRKLERENIVWGYTAVVDESKFNHVLYVVLLKMKPMNKELAELIITRKIREEPKKQNVRLINVLYVNGEYDWMIMFSAPNHATARRYYDSLRIAYHDHLLEKPVIIDINFSLVREGKINPEVQKLKEYVAILLC